MKRLSLFISIFCILSVVGCGESVDSPNPNPVPQDTGIQPQVGDWPVITTGWTDDECNAAEGLSVPTSVTISNADSSSFSITFFDGDTRIGDGSLRCTYDRNDVYNCTNFTNSFSYPFTDALISIVGPGSVTVTSETAASGKGQFVLECEGSDCDQIATQSNSGRFPCNTTLNWTAEAP